MKVCIDGTQIENSLCPLSNYCYTVMIDRCLYLHHTGVMENAGVLVLLLAARIYYCMPVLEDNSLDPEDVAVLYDETVAKDTGSCHCVYISLSFLLYCIYIKWRHKWTSITNQISSVHANSLNFLLSACNRRESGCLEDGQRSEPWGDGLVPGGRYYDTQISQWADSPDRALAWGNRAVRDGKFLQ